MELPDFSKYGYALYQFVIGPVLRVLTLLVLVLYVYGFEAVGQWLGVHLPTMEELTSTRTKAFMELYGLSTLMPLIVLVLVVAVVHAGEALIMGVASYLPPKVQVISPQVEVAAVGIRDFTELARSYGDVEFAEELPTRVEQTLAEARQAGTYQERLGWPDYEERRRNAVSLWQFACKSYLLLSLTLLVISVGEESEGQALRASYTVVFSVLALAATSIWYLVRYKRWVRARYSVARHITRLRPPSEVSKERFAYDSESRSGRWWRIAEIDTLSRGSRRLLSKFGL